LAKSLAEWIATDVESAKDKSVRWLSEHYFFRDPPRPTYSDVSYFFSPADGIILYQKVVTSGDDPIVEIKGRPYSLRDAMHDATYDRPSLVIAIFMTFYDVHVNRVPYAGLLSYRYLEPIDTYNHPMLDVEKGLLEARVSLSDAEYLHHNQRMLNRFYSVQLGQSYYVLQVADYDVDCIVTFDVRQHQPRLQGERFSQIRFGSQVDLIVPLSPRQDFILLQEVGHHVEAGIDPLIVIRSREDGV
jgi:phosphatidylserine decarboxylase